MYMQFSTETCLGNETFQRFLQVFLLNQYSIDEYPPINNASAFYAIYNWEKIALTNRT